MTNKELLDNYLKNLNSIKLKWAQTPIKDKLNLLQSVKINLKKNSHHLVQIISENKKIDHSELFITEEWLTGPVILMKYLSQLQRTLQNNLKINLKIKKNNHNHYECQVLPYNFKDRLVWKGISAKIILQKGKEPTQGQHYFDAKFNGGCSLVLGAGNVSSIAPTDAIYKLFAENKVCLVKLNPVNDYLYDVFLEIFKPLIQLQVLYFIKGNVEDGKYLCEHKDIDDIHMTGSEQTHFKIVWGNDENLKTTQPLIQKQITSELGCVTPVCIFPGLWSDKELNYVANQFVGAMTNNASFNCNAFKVIVMSSEWKQKELFKNILKQKLSGFPTRPAYYPGAQERYNQILHENKNELIFQSKVTEKSHLPWTIIENLSPKKENIFFKRECFCSLFSIVEIHSQDIQDFSNKVLQFYNEKLYGNLSTSIFIDPKTKAENKKIWNQFIEKLNYGCIGINCWAALSYAMGVTTWGAFPGNTLQNIKSGIGTVHNSFLIDFPEKSIVEAPFYSSLTPLWVPYHKNGFKTSKSLLEYEYKPTLKNMFKLFYEGIQG